MPQKKRLSIKLLQLPIPEIHNLYTEGNIPLAAGYLKATALQKRVVEDKDIQIIPREMANYAGDAAILKWVLQENTDIVGFTSYMWNIDRNIHLAHKIKEEKPGITVLCGGPEIDHRHWVFKNKHIDALVIGEGEEAFIDFIKDLKTGKPVKRFYQSQKPVDLKKIPNPYLEKILVPWQKESMFLETMRGCPYPCKYCFYSKSYSSMRFFPGEYLPKLLAMARDYGVPELYFMDPSFNVSPQLKEKLARIQGLNTTGIPIHTEIRLEGVTQEIARLMKKAGFRSLEAGLQSTNEKSLTAIGRDWNREKFIQGAQLLREQGIDIKTGVILGLPFDTLEHLECTLDFVIDLNLADSMEIYPLSLIPGTQLRDEAQSLGMTYMPYPPYWVISTRYLSQKDLKFAVEMIENKLEIEFFPAIIPRFENFHPGYFHFLDLREKEKLRCQLNVLYRYPERVGHSLTILIGEESDITQLVKLGRWLQRVSPFTLVQLVMDRNTVPPDEDIQRLSGAFYSSQHYFNHIHHYKADSQGKYSLRFFHLTDNLKIAELYLYQPRYCDLVLRYKPGLIEKARDILEEKPILLVEPAVGGKELAELKRIYQDFENFLVCTSDPKS
ncbi:MAG: radical SAM protein [Candidatus Aminicenantes bacterium]|nr:MAG: radical SAM protein [Candidatus Aminicenantes bacterium]